MPLVRWLKGGTVTGNSRVATTSASNFVNDENHIEIEIEVDCKRLDVYLKIVEEVIVDEKETLEVATYSYDKNMIHNYI